MKVTRAPLLRGTKLTPEAVFGNGDGLDAIASDLSGVGVTRDNLEASLAPVTVHISVPYLDSEIFNYHARQGATPGYCVPVILPPLQEFFQSDTGDEPQLVLEAMSLSFDQRSEGAAIHGPFQSVNAAGAVKDTYAGLLDFVEITRLGLRVVLYEKAPIVSLPENAALNARLTCTAKSWQPNFLPDRVVFETSLADVLFAGGGRQNPYVQTDIARQIDPYKSYCLAVIADGLDVLDAAPRDDFALPAFNLELRFTHPLVPTPWRQGGSAIQNAPQVNTQKAGHAVAVVTPAVGTALRADGPSGVSTAMTDLDEVLRHKLRGGLDAGCNKPGAEALKDDSSYDVITVPMYQAPFNGCIKATSGPSQGAAALPAAPGTYFGAPTQLPYYTNDTGAVESRRIIPLPYPMEIHHVIAHVNYQKAEAMTVDANPGIRHKIGVGLGLGLKADSLAYTQVAYADFVPKWEATGLFSPPKELLDRWAYPWDRGVDPSAVFDGGLPTAKNLAWESYGVPLVYVGGSEGAGYITQGPPVFAGRAVGAGAGKLAYNGVNPRTDIANGIAGVNVYSNTYGAEQWLEVRWQMIADDVYTQGAAGWSNLTADSPIVGYGGVFLTIIGKKYITE